VSATEIYDLLQKSKALGDRLPDPFDSQIIANAVDLYDVAKKLVCRVDTEEELQNFTDAIKEIREIVLKCEEPIYAS
jgi:hypothetical protein